MRLFVTVVTLTILVGCQSPTASKPVNQVLTISQSDAKNDGVRWWAFSPLTDLGKTRAVTVTTPPGTVTYLLTNTSASASANANLSGVGGDVAARTVSDASPRSFSGSPRRLSLSDVSSAPDIPTSTPGARSLVPGPSFTVGPVGTDVGTSTFDFVDALWSTTPKTANHHLSTLRKRVTVTTDNVHALNIWVANDCWKNTSGAGAPDSGKKTGLDHGVTQEMVDALAQRFLTDGVNDIYGWDTGIFGAEWQDSGAPHYNYLGHDYTMIDSQGNIHIFVSNLNPTGTANGVLEGYFHALNNFPAQGSGAGAQTGSNGLILFALDADTLGNPSDTGDDENTNWAITDYYPSEAASTLAHEFQHMIHFYQKQVLHNLAPSTATWINEMCSMLTEDLLSQKLTTLGPRGVLGTDLATGSAPNEDNRGRLPYYVYWHDVVALPAWYSGANVLLSYSNAYGFGSWLLRNYGGPELLRDIVQNGYTTEQAVVSAVNDQIDAHGFNNGVHHTYATLVRDWGLATFLGSSTQSGVQYSSGGTNGADGFTWVDGDETYQVGSINLNNYRYSWEASADGPAGHADGVWVDNRGFRSGDAVPAGATSMHTIGSFSSRSVTLKLPPNVVLTVVVQQ